MACVYAAGRGRRRGARDREGQGARRKAFKWWRWRRDVVWAREDVCWAAWMVLGCRSLTGCCASTRTAEQRLLALVTRGGCARQRPSADEVAITFRPAASSSYPVGGGARHATTPLPSFPPPTLNDNIEDEDAAGAIPSDLSPASTCGASAPNRAAASRGSTQAAKRARRESAGAHAGTQTVGLGIRSAAICGDI
jgi:hypothetical protein